MTLNTFLVLWLVGAVAFVLGMAFACWTRAGEIHEATRLREALARILHSSNSRLGDVQIARRALNYRVSARRGALE